MNTTISVVIPALNEAILLPELLRTLSRQTLLPLEVIVADAGSQDGTVELAQQANATVVPGGKPAKGRNAGAEAACGELLLFLDADVLPPDDFIEKFVQEFEQRSLDVATAGIQPESDSSTDKLIAEATNTYLELIQMITPHAGGYCILIRRSLHERIGGFDETLALAEDHNYVQRAAQLGKFGLVTGARIGLSMRRIEKEGMTRLALMYLYSEIHVLAGRPIRSTPFEYEFGNFTERQQGFLRGELQELREQISQIGNPLIELSEQGRSSLRSILRQSPSLDDFMVRIQNLQMMDLAVLRKYLKRRQRMINLRASRILQEAKEQISELQPVRFIETHFKPKDFHPSHDGDSSGTEKK